MHSEGISINLPDLDMLNQKMKLGVKKFLTNVMKLWRNF